MCRGCALGGRNGPGAKAVSCQLTVRAEFFLLTSSTVTFFGFVSASRDQLVEAEGGRAVSASSRTLGPRAIKRARKPELGKVR